MKLKLTAIRLKQDIYNGIIKYVGTIPMVNYNNRLYLVSKDSQSIEGCTIFYSRPDNKHHEPFKEIKRSTPKVKDNYIDASNEGWTRLKPGLKVRGSVIDNMFYIKFTENDT